MAGYGLVADVTIVTGVLLPLEVVEVASPPATDRQDSAREHCRCSLDDLPIRSPSSPERDGRPATMSDMCVALHQSSFGLPDCAGVNPPEVWGKQKKQAQNRFSALLWEKPIKRVLYLLSVQIFYLMEYFCKTQKRATHL